MYHLNNHIGQTATSSLSKGLAIVSLVAMSWAPALAHDGAVAELTTTPSPSKAPRATIKDKALEKTAEVKDKVATRLSDAKLKICQNRETAIQKRSTQLTKLAEKMIANFEKHATRVQTYYTDIVVPAGRTVDNYDGLVTEIATQKAATQTALTTAQAQAEAFNCDGDDPKGQLKTFNEQMRTVKKSLKDYRTAVRNLIVAVRGQKGEDSPKPVTSISPKPTISPTASVSSKSTPSPTTSASPAS